MSSSEDYSSEDDEDYVPECCSNDENDKSDADDNDAVDQLEHDSNKLDKQEVDVLWKNFKNETLNQGAKTTKKLSSNDEHDSVTNNNTDIKSEISNENAEETSSAATKNKDTVTITKVYDFAGEEVKVTKEVKRDSVEAKKHFKEQSTSVPPKGPLGRSSLGNGLKKRPGGGIGSVLGKLGKKPKLSTLEKSKLDWNKYKEREGIEEELQAHNKGKQGYLEKVSFLERTEMRQFEKERDMRLSKSGR